MDDLRAEVLEEYGDDDHSQDDVPGCHDCGVQLGVLDDKVCSACSRQRLQHEEELDSAVERYLKRQLEIEELVADGDKEEDDPSHS